ncbi:MAG: glutamate synthase large subunit [Candidatus Tectomicrobia bacterium]|nr:glutamate synthase large subunit [Candidatus Tectomicrobia bacterium]
MARREPHPPRAARTGERGTGAVLDRNGLRPSRYYVTKDGLVVMASEVGVLDILPENVLLKERLHPGRIFLVDTAEGRIIDDEEIKRRYASAKPYKKWLAENLVPLEKLPDAPELPEPDHETVLQRQMAFGYTDEDLRFFLAPMALKGDDPVGSMGSDTALPVLSNRSRLLYDYFKQLFAQVTNPPLDCIREELVTQMSVTIGAGGNLLKPGEASCRQIKLESPILDNEGLAKIGHVKHPFFRTARISILFPAKEGLKGLKGALDELFRQADRAIEGGHNILIISDRGVNQEMAPIPALLATAGVHHHLVRSGTRTKVGLVLETGQARQVHQMCVLIGYGANAINPYLAFETLDDMIRGGMLAGLDHKTALKNYIKALKKGILKVISKMGISTIQSYCGAQVFEAVGLNKEFVDRYFTWTASRVGGIGLDVVAEETLMRHRRAFPERPAGRPELDGGGEIQWRRDGEIHLFNPETVFKLQHATWTGQFKVFKEYTKRVDDQSRGLATLRGLFEFKPARKPVPLGEVEPVEAIVRRFATGAMSYGSISQEAHETLAIAMNRLGGKSNTGEGGEDPARYVPDPNGDSRRSAIKQVASGRFGVTSEYLVNADDLQIKMAQGAKPGEGGQLPGHKVYPWIAKVRYSTPGVGLISPPPHHDIYSIEDLAQLIYDLKNSNPRARIHVKLVSEVGVGTVAAGVAKAHSDVVLISGHDGGTGASPITSIKHAGTPWELGLAETQQVLVLNKLRDRIIVQVDGQLKTGRDVVIGALLGADEFGFATAPLVVMGCVMMRVCHLNTCPVGVATQDPELRKRFTGKPEFVENFFRFIAEEVREYMSLLGFRTMEEMTGRVDRLNVRKALDHWKAKGLDYSAILHKPDMGPGVAIRCVRGQDHGLERTLDATTLVPACREAIEKKAPVTLHLRIENVNRTVGTILGSEISKRHGAQGLPEDTISIHFKGSAGQSFGAFVPRGITLTLEGDSNDYIGKGLSGGKLIVFPPKESSFAAERNILIGNVALYGATGGDAYFRGIAGERFCVRNSGAHAVGEGVGDHGCEYMTGGRVVVLGRSGRNFAAGMSGGVAYVLDEAGGFRRRCNMEMVDLEELVAPDDVEEVKTLVRNHANYTASEVAQRVLARWAECQPKFVKIMPRDYKRALTAIQRAKEEGIPWEVAVMEGAHG